MNVEDTIAVYDGYATRCQYCAAATGRTDREWATEDVCDDCARPLLVSDAMERFDMCEAAAEDFVRVSCVKRASLTFDELRTANLRRSPHFKNARGQVSDSDKTYTLSDHVTALAGEVGEAANIVKKIARGDYGLDDDFGRDEESAWLIEATGSGGPLYWDGLSSDGDAVASGWTTSPDRAVRFAGVSDAASVARVIREYGCDLETRVTQHVWLGPAITVREALAKEIADAQCYLDKLARAAGVDLGEATRKKFNEVSDRVGSEVKL